MTDTSGAARGADSISHARMAGAVLLAALVVLADILFWQSEPGISLFIFFAALAVAVVAVFRTRLADWRSWLLIAIALLAAAPFIESLSPWALLTAQAGVTLLALGLAGLLPRFADWPAAFARFGLLAPLRLVDDSVRALADGGRRKAGSQMLRGVVTWIVPAIFAVIFVLLFSAANPLVEMALRAVHLDALLRLLDSGRLLLWGFVAVFAWPFIVPRLLGWVPALERHGPFLPRAESQLFGRSAILNSLIVFNAIFAVQTVLDLVFLWGGVRLPEGIGYAEYAHRGAYPLIVTAILAGAFVLAAMRRNGPGYSSPLIRNLVFLWIAQNVWLVVSSLLRLELYVEIYHLSEMRIAAAIWMGLVAVGLVLIVARIVFDRSNRWLVTCNLLALTLTLWTVSWVDVRALVAGYNVRHSYEVTGQGTPLDRYYTGQLGPTAIPALDDFLASAMHVTPEVIESYTDLRNELAADFVRRQTGDWRSWTWREQRLLDYLGLHPVAPPPDSGIH